MTIDTEDKRRSVSDFYLYVLRPVPDATIGASDREQASGLYSGILANPPPQRTTHNTRQTMNVHSGLMFQILNGRTGL